MLVAAGIRLRWGGEFGLSGRSMLRAARMGMS
jgi:hypothetical protein